ncbi:MAG: N-acetyltransferase [Bacillaceae bacterium]|nr:N-acetyltransferase [Bacillaceae bacterium]
MNLEEDWNRVREIFQEGIDTGKATFETEPPSLEKWEKSKVPGCSIVACDDTDIVGWAALSPVSDRCVYAGVAELSVYIGKNFRGMGAGRKLLQHIISLSEEKGIWTLQAAIFPENEASLRLHQKMGFRIVGRRERIGQLNGEWKDTILLERRSRVVGISS